MKKRKYTYIQVGLPEIRRLLARGASQREIGEILELSGGRPIRNPRKRERWKRQPLEYRFVRKAGHGKMLCRAI